MQIAVWVVGVAVALFALDRLFLWMEAKGWVYWRKKERPGGAGLTGMRLAFTAAALALAAPAYALFADPGTRHLREASEERAVEDEDDGDDDDKRKPDDQVS
jgi:hypothetical protein